METTNLPVLIYQPGKCGSHTIERTLCRNGIPSIAMHALAWKEIHRAENLYPEKKEMHHMRRTVRRTIDVAPDNVRWKVITIVRETVAHSCSSSFGNRKRFFPNLIDQPEEQMLAAIVDKTLSDLKDLGTQESYTDLWFDREMKEVFECDVFSVPFNRSQGFQIYRAPRADILLFKSEQLSECFQQALSLFLDCNITQLQNCNVASGARGTPSEQMYERMKRAAKMPLCDLQQVYSKRYIKHFYTPDQIAGFIQKWVDMEQLPVKQDHTTLSITS